MTIETTVNKTIQSGNGSNKDFDFAFEIPDEDSLSLTKRGSDGTETAITTNFTVTGIGNEAGGTVNYPTSGSALGASEKIIIKRVVALKQNENLRNQGDYSLEDIEDALDRAVMLCQQLQEQIDRSLKLPLTSSSTYVTVDDFVANKLLYVSSDGTKVKMSDADFGSIQTYLAALVAIAADISAVAAIDTDVTAVAAINTDVSTVAAIAADVSAVAAIDSDVTQVSSIHAAVSTVSSINAAITSIVANMTSIQNAASFGFPTLVSGDEYKMLQIKADRSGYSAVEAISRKNAIINGDFNIWQRGTSFTAVANETYMADRFIYNKSGAALHTVSRSTDVPTFAQAGRLFNYSALIDCTTADSSIAANDFVNFSQKIEGYNWLPLAQKPSALSFWAKATKTGIYCVSLRNSGLDRSYVSEFTINAANTWELKRLVFAASPSAGTWNYENGIGVYLSICLSAGSDFHTAKDAWQVGNYFATANQVNACDNAGNHFRICGIQLEGGSIPTPFEQRSIQQEELLCYRYYIQKPLNGGIAVGFDSTDVGITVNYPVVMRVTPSQSLLSTSITINDSASLTNRTSSGSSIQQSNNSKHGSRFRINGFTGINASRPYTLEDTSDVYAASAEL